MSDIFKTISTIPRRLIFLLMLVLMIFTVLNPITLPIKISASTQNLFDSIEAIEEGDIVLLYNGAGPVAYSSLRSAYEVSLWHLLKQKPRIIFVSMIPESMPILDTLLSDAKIKDLMDDLGYVENVNYVNLGLVFEEAGLVELVQDFHGATRNNYIGTWLDEVEDGGDFDHVLDFAGGNSYKWMAQHLNIAYGTKIYSIIGTGSYPTLNVYITAGQIKAGLNGLIGSNEYEMVAKNEYDWQPSEAVTLLGTYSATHLFLVLLIILGNIGHFGWERKNISKV